MLYYRQSLVRERSAMVTTIAHPEWPYDFEIARRVPRRYPYQGDLRAINETIAVVLDSRGRATRTLFHVKHRTTDRSVIDARHERVCAMIIAGKEPT